jgi:hypothetical protein
MNQIYPIEILIKTLNQLKLITNYVNIIDENTFEIKLEYIQINTLLYDDYYIYHEFEFLYKDYTFDTKYNIKCYDGIDEQLLHNHTYKYLNIKLDQPSSNIIEFLYSIHNTNLNSINLITNNLSKLNFN